jgi:hypothetical protein
MKIVMVLTSHDQLGNTDHKTGFWLEEFAAPYLVSGTHSCNFLAQRGNGEGRRVLEDREGQSLFDGVGVLIELERGQAETVAMRGLIGAKDSQSRGADGMTLRD